MKKLAIRAGVILAIVVACSMFFSQTILTITTPKVKFAQVSYKRFEEKITLDGVLYFPKTDKITVEAARKSPVVVDKMYVRVGDRVNTGDTICTTKLSSGYEQALETANQALQQARDAYIQNETANIKLIDTADTDTFAAKRALDEAMAAMTTAQSALLSEAAKQGIVLPEDVTRWAGEIQKAGNEALTLLMEDTMDAQALYDRAMTAFLDIYSTSKTKKEVFDFLVRRAELQRAIDRAQADLVELVAGTEALSTLRAAHEGVILVLNLQEGQAYDGNSVAYELSTVGDEPVLRCDVSRIDRELTEGMRVDIKTEYDSLRTQVTGIQREGIDTKYLHVALTQDIIDRMGGLRTMLDRSTSLSLTYRAKDTNVILPSGVVRNEGEGKDYVWLPEYRANGIFGSSMVARKTSVTVLFRGDKEVAIQEDLRYGYAPVYQEDRPIEEGKRIMEYVN